MLTLKTCGICGINVFHFDFLRDPDTGSPKYFASAQFHPELTDDIIFCSAQHSLEWYEKELDKNKEIS